MAEWHLFKQKDENNKCKLLVKIGVQGQFGQMSDSTKVM
jgi:hypothetical protein